MKPEFITELGLNKATTDVINILNFLFVGYIISSTTREISFVCGNNIFYEIKQHPNVRHKVQESNCALYTPKEIRDRLQRRIEDIDKVIDFFFIDQIMFILVKDRGINNNEAVFECSEYTSILKTI